MSTTLSINCGMLYRMSSAIIHSPRNYIVVCIHVCQRGIDTPGHVAPKSVSEYTGTVLIHVGLLAYTLCICCLPPYRLMGSMVPGALLATCPACTYTLLTSS